MIGRLFHAWERRLAALTTDRVVGSFDWGADWLDAADSNQEAPGEAVVTWSAHAMEDTDQFFETPTTDQYRLVDDLLSFPSALQTPDRENNVAYARYLRADSPGRPRRAVVVLPHWNAGPDEHMGLSRLIARFGMSALRLSLPYHDRRMPPQLHRADYIVSPNIARTVQVCRQAVLDARRAVHWLAAEGYDRIGILGTSLGSCLAMLTAAHEPRVTVAALNHISPFFADVVWAVHRSRPCGSRSRDRTRPAPPTLASDQPLALYRTDARQARVAGLCALRSVIPRSALATARGRVSAAIDPP